MDAVNAYSIVGSAVAATTVLSVQLQFIVKRLIKHTDDITEIKVSVGKIETACSINHGPESDWRRKGDKTPCLKQLG